ncbi:DegT/DnrJ/EryC1/StrS family aminotransferase [uncultured Tolumonas sp.]|uniref:DegT/DnrJ/EryC1/StrS family aminotransferase n=1 Tax=uncultured Tolumonas sp. TaxID=263765 RepID=UPI002A0A873C|nr:DegT/DnrJ/EryC1/StrS family aminotransferase [uncultured Tolumonas sp.]
MKIPFLDLKMMNARYESELKSACSRVIESGWYIAGNELSSFESSFAGYCNTAFCVGVGNGYDALVLVLRAWKQQGKLHDGDEVLVPRNTFIATVAAIIVNNLVPVLVDVDPDTFNIDLNLIVNASSEKTKVIIPVHLYGLLAPMPEIIAIAHENGWLVLEDCAQAHGAEINGRKAGAWGNASAFSFYPGKNLGALGDAGCITTNDTELYKLLKLLRSYGSVEKYHHEFLGVNSRLDEIQAAMLKVKLKYLDEEITFRRHIANRYLSEIKNPHIILPKALMNTAHVWHLFVVRCQSRDKLKQYLAGFDIQTMVHYPFPVDYHKPYSNLKVFKSRDGGAHNFILSLPISPSINDDEQSFIIDKINGYLI